MLDVPDDGPLDVPVVVVFRVDRIEPPGELDRNDRERMCENLCSADVLDAARFPAVELRGHYAGSFDAGRLEGDLIVRGARHRLVFHVSILTHGTQRLARGAWEGRLTDLGIKPFRALMGALRLEDWIRLRLEATFDDHDLRRSHPS